MKEFLIKNKKIVLVLIVILIFLYFYYSSQKEQKSPLNCKIITPEEWEKQKKSFWEKNGNDWTKAHAQMLDMGYCEQFT